MEYLVLETGGLMVVVFRKVPLYRGLCDSFGNRELHHWSLMISGSIIHFKVKTSLVDACHATHILSLVFKLQQLVLPNHLYFEKERLNWHTLLSTLVKVCSGKLSSNSLYYHQLWPWSSQCKQMDCIRPIMCLKHALLLHNRYISCIFHTWCTHNPSIWS